MKVLSVLVWTEGLNALVWPGLRQLHCCYNFINRYCLQLASVPLPRYQLNRARKSKSVKEETQSAVIGGLAMALEKRPWLTVTCMNLKV